MARQRKILKKWLAGQKEERIETVKAIVSRFFERHEFKRGSHIIVCDSRLAGKEGYGPQGILTVPVKGGQKVKGYYLKKIVRALEEIGIDPDSV